jgi:DNA polymerase III epsilon subunit family exonuclease
MPLFLDDGVVPDPAPTWSATGPRDPVVTPAVGGQRSFDELGEPLREVTFVVVDLETTGGSPATEAITEIGAVKVRGGQVLGEFATLVDPGRTIPPQITMLTGITNAMVYDAPRISSVLPAFLEFARGSVLVAHNARFDVGFLRAACARQQVPWPGPAVVDTVRLARKVLPRAEAPSVRLSALAALLGARTRPDHRALTDARPSCRTPAGTSPRSGGASGGWPIGCPRPPASICSAVRARRCFTSVPPATWPSGCVRISRRPRTRPGSTRWWPWPNGSTMSSAPTPWRRTSASSG